jgi:transcriptional regulator with XRE-family HTH domain
MTLGQKLRYLRTVEGHMRGAGRPMTQLEVVAAMQRELRKTLSQSYLSQIENGARPHLTNTTRTLLAKFFKVHPGFLVDDPKGRGANLESDLATTEGKLDVWFVHLAERFQSDGEVSDALMGIAGQKDTRGALLLLGAILEVPGLATRVRALVKQQRAGATPLSTSSASSTSLVSSTLTTSTSSKTASTTSPPASNGKAPSKRRRTGQK